MRYEHGQSWWMHFQHRWWGEGGEEIVVISWFMAGVCTKSPILFRWGADMNQYIHIIHIFIYILLYPKKCDVDSPQKICLMYRSAYC